MNIYTSRGWLVSVVSGVLLLAYSVPVQSQCMTVVTGGPGATITGGGMMGIYVGKTVTNGTMCTLTMFMNVAFCGPGGQPPVTGAMRTMAGGGVFLTATALTTAMNVSCGWDCNCGAVVTSGASNGLPVELLDFKVSSVPQTPSPLEELSKNDVLVSRRP